MKVVQAEGAAQSDPWARGEAAAAAGALPPPTLNPSMQPGELEPWAGGCSVGQPGWERAPSVTRSVTLPPPVSPWHPQLLRTANLPPWAQLSIRQ